MAIDTLENEVKKLYNYENLCLLWRQAEANGSIDSSLTYTHGDKQEKISYALLDPKKDWSVENKEGISLNKFVEIATKRKMTGFYHDDMIFILSENVPEKFRQYVVLHEITERELEGIAEDNILDLSGYYENEKERKEFMERELKDAARYPHQQACVAEISEIFENGKEFAEEYSNWLKETNWDLDDQGTYFNQAIPDYLKKNNLASEEPLKVLIDFYLKIKPVCWNWEIKKIVGKFPWIEPFVKDKEFS
jgi:hypothetical protein